MSYSADLLDIYGYVYVVIDLATNMKYIGQHKAKQFDPEYKPGGKLIRRFMKKYGLDRFKIRPIDCAYSKEELNEVEMTWIKKIDCIWPKGYNLSIGGNGSSCGPRSQETKEKIKNSLYIWRQTPEGIKVRKEAQKKQRKAMIGRVFTKEHKEKLKKPKTLEHNKKNSQAQIGRPKKHIEGCRCPFCKMKRGEAFGKKHPMYGKSHTKKTKEKISLSGVGRKWIYNVQLKRITTVKLDKVKEYLKNGWLLGRGG